MLDDTIVITRKPETLDMRDEDNFERHFWEGWKQGVPDAPEEGDVDRAWATLSKSTADALMEQHEPSTSKANKKGTIPKFVQRTLGVPTRRRMIREVHART